jgi:hypothetical protein
MDENTTPEERPAEETTGQPAEPTQPAATFEAGEGPEADARADAAWREMISQLDAFAQAAGRWARSAVDDPENRARATELKEHVEKTAKEIGDSIEGGVDSAAKSDVGASFKDAATKTGEAFATAGKRVSEEAAPHMANAFHSAAEALRTAAEKMERSAPPPPPPAAGDEDASAGADDGAEGSAEPE